MADEVRLVSVDGEAFRVRLHEDGGFDCEWLSGPNPGYGFGSGASSGYVLRARDGVPSSDVALPPERADDDRVRSSIRGFLAMIDPRTGFVGD